MVMMTTMTMRLQFRVTSASGSSLLDIFEPWSGSGCPLLPDPSAYQVILISFGGVIPVTGVSNGMVGGAD